MSFSKFVSFSRFDLPHDGDAIYRDLYANQKRAEIIPYHWKPVERLTKIERDRLYKQTKEADIPKDPTQNASRKNHPLSTKEMVNLLKYIDFVPVKAKIDRNTVVEMIKNDLIGKLVLGVHDGKWYRIKQFVSLSPYTWTAAINRKTLWDRLRFWKSTRLPVDVGQSLADSFSIEYKMRIRDFPCIVTVESFDEVRKSDLPPGKVIQEVQLPLDVCFICCAPN